MKVTLEVSEETLAGIWANTWGDKEKDGMKQRLQGILEKEACLYFQAFPGSRQVVPGEYRRSPHFLKEGV